MFMWLEIVIGVIILLAIVLIVRRKKRNTGNVRPSKNFKKRLRQVSMDGDHFFADEEHSVSEVRRSSARIDSEAAQLSKAQQQEGDIPVLFDQADQEDQDWPQQTTPFAKDSDVQKSLFDDLEVPAARQPKPRNKTAAVTESARPDAPASAEAVDKSGQQQLLEQVLILNLHAEGDNYYGGVALFNCFRELGLRYGKHEIFHYHADDSNHACFQMANGVNPGTFDYDNQQDFVTPMLCFILPLETDKDNNQALDRLLVVLTDIQNRFGGTIKDENRSDISEQGIAHYRSQIKDFERQMLVNKK